MVVARTDETVCRIIYRQRCGAGPGAVLVDCLFDVKPVGSLSLTITHNSHIVDPRVQGTADKKVGAPVGKRAVVVGLKPDPSIIEEHSQSIHVPGGVHDNVGGPGFRGQVNLEEVYIACGTNDSVDSDTNGDAAGVANDASLVVSRCGVQDIRAGSRFVPAYGDVISSRTQISANEKVARLIR